MSIQPQASSNDRAAMTRIVGLGASAGGLAALEAFFTAVPAGSTFAYLVVQHLDPTQKAMLAELLQRVTPMHVLEAAEAMRVDPGVVYVIPPNTELSMAAGLLHLAAPSQPRGMRLPVDLLFCSLARELGARAIGLVLSGMGADGTLGLQAIKAAGGFTLAQAPDSCAFDSMPSSAIAAKCVDVVATPADMPEHIARVSGSVGTADAAQAGVGAEASTSDASTRDASAGDRSAGDRRAAASLAAIHALLRERNTHDLSLYKTSTFVRRVERRMAVHRLPSIMAYESFLRENPGERDLLFKEVLIGVTAFFRDPLVWEQLRDGLLPDLLARRLGATTQLRAWVVGCSTGEEAYTLAMTFREAVDAKPEFATYRLQIFATDLSSDAIAVARRGQYPLAIATTMAPTRLARFFTHQDGGYRIDRGIRESVLFAQHDVIMDPPFTRLDIVSCRNLLIYFTAALQERLIPLFHYSLRPGGLLLLGESETIGRSHKLFLPLHAKSRLYRRGDAGVQLGSVDFPVRRRPSFRTATQELNVTPTTVRPLNLQAVADQLLLDAYAPPAVLVNDGGDVLYISGRIGRYLEPAAGKANWNIHVMARPGLRVQLAAALRQVAQTNQTVELHGLPMDESADAAVNVSVRAIHAPSALAGMVLIAFRELPPVPRRARARRGSGAIDPTTTLKLDRARDEIQALQQEMRASQEELQAANEELQSTNEELQSANEELTSSKEEAQSMNEELQTINTELQSKLDDLALAQSDMQNLLNSTDIATLFLDNQLNVRRYTDQIARVIHLREGDIGRPLSDLATTLVYPQLRADTQETLRTLAHCERQIPTTDGHWYTVRIMPYRTLTNVIQGAVLTFVDITAAKELESRLRQVQQ